MTTKKKTASRKKVAKKSRAVSPRQKALPSKGGRPLFSPTTEDRQRVSSVAGLLNQDAIALLVLDPKTQRPISLKTLRRHFPVELETGKAKKDAMVAASLVKRALDMSHPQGATCAIFYAKTQMNWSETLHVKADVRSGVLVAPGAVDPNAWIAGAAKRTADARDPGEDES